MQYSVKNFARSMVSLVGRHQWPVFGSDLVILAYHRVLPKNDERFEREQPTMSVSPETFENNIKWAKEHFEYISLREWLLKSKAGSPPKGKYCAVTFDDGWLDNYEFAFPVLKKYQVPATIFCVSSMVDFGTDFWPGRLAMLVDNASRSHETSVEANANVFSWLLDACKDKSINWVDPIQKDFDKMIEANKVYSDAAINLHITQSKAALNLGYQESRQVINAAEIAEMMASGLIEIGSHTNSHTRLFDDTECRVLIEEVVESKEFLSKKIGSGVELFCYPNGYHPARVEKMVAENYLGGCTLDRGWNKHGDDFATLKRICFHENIASNRAFFKSMLSGWL